MTTGQWFLAWGLYLVITGWWSLGQTVYDSLGSDEVDKILFFWYMMFWIVLGILITWVIAI